MINRKEQAKQERIQRYLVILVMAIAAFAIFRVALEQQHQEDCATVPLNQRIEYSCN